MADHKQQNSAQNSGAQTQHKPDSGRPELSGTFTVEFGDEHGRRPSLGTLRKSYRGYWSLAQQAARRDENGKRIGSREFGEGISQMPDVPGIHMEIDLDRKFAREYDPLSDDPDKLADACRALGIGRGNQSYKAKPWPTIKYDNLDPHVFKTLVREVMRLVDAGMARVISGHLPKIEAVDKLPGRYLHDVWNSNANRPRFEDQVDEYLKNLELAATT